MVTTKSVLETVGQAERRSEHFEIEADHPDLMRMNLFVT